MVVVVVVVVVVLDVRVVRVVVGVGVESIENRYSLHFGLGPDAGLGSAEDMMVADWGWDMTLMTHYGVLFWL